MHAFQKNKTLPFPLQEEQTQLIPYSALHFSSDFELDHVLSHVVPTLSDQKRRVRQASLECVAVCGSCLGPKRSGLIYRAVLDAHEDEGDKERRRRRKAADGQVRGVSSWL